MTKASDVSLNKSHSREEMDICHFNSDPNLIFWLPPNSKEILDETTPFNNGIVSGNVALFKDQEGVVAVGFSCPWGIESQLCINKLDKDFMSAYIENTHPAKGGGRISIGLDGRDLFWIFMKSNKRDSEWKQNFDKYIPQVQEKFMSFLNLDQLHSIKNYNS